MLMLLALHIVWKPNTLYMGAEVITINAAIEGCTARFTTNTTSSIQPRVIHPKVVEKVLVRLNRS